ncbi:MAG: hypothetical protein ACREDR_06390 [Blastocatellia bacterium]
MDREKVTNAATDWMAQRGWKEKLAKQRGGEQSLFEHSLIELDVFLELADILSAKQHYDLSDQELEILAVSVLAHDVGKETDAWQAYVRGGPTTGHIFPELTRALVPDLCASLGLRVSEGVVLTMAQCAESHHNRPGRSDGEIFEAILGGGTDRFMVLANLVKGIDHFCSAQSPALALDVARRDHALRLHLAVSYHQAAIRGVSTTFVHRAAQMAFEKNGWRSLLTFPEGTVYGADPISKASDPTADEISELLRVEIDRGIARDVTGLMVGSPTGNMLPKPHLLAFDESREYLFHAAKKISPKSFAKKKLADKRRVVEEYWKLKGRSGRPSDAEVEDMSNSISVAQPEMLVFKFFKAMTDPDKIEVLGRKGPELAEQLYDEVFGADSWAALQSTSTLMPAKDMAKTVDFFWGLPGSRVGKPQNESVQTIPDSERTEILVGLLYEIACKVYAAVDGQSPREGLSGDMSAAFIQDLIRPTQGGNVRAIAEQQLEHYIESKPFAGRDVSGGIYLCPICNAPFNQSQGHIGGADFVDNPQTHTNRAVAHGKFGYVMICSSCYYERLLSQVLLGTRPGQIITLMPRVSLGPAQGRRLTAAVRHLVEAAQGIMRGEVGDLNYGFSFGLTEIVAARLANANVLELRADDLASLFTYRFSGDTQKKRKQEALKRLKAEFGDDVQELNATCEESFSSWDDALKAVLEDRIALPEARAIKREVFRLYDTLHVVCETPNLIFIPLTYDIASGSDESETSKGLRRLFIALLLSTVLDAAVAVHREGEPIDFQGRSGAAYVPPAPAVRALIRYDWIPIDKAKYWIDAIGAASMLARDTGLPSRSSLYQTLSAEPAEWLAHRIQEASKGGSKLTRKHLGLIGKLPGFHRTNKEVTA